MGESGTVRQATESDVTAMVEVYRPIVVDTAISFEIEIPDEAVFAEKLRRTVHPDVWLVFEEEGRVVGYAHSTTFRDRPAYQGTRETTVYVHARYRRTGVARSLMTHLLTQMAASGLHRAVAAIVLPNDASIALHEDLGYVQVGIFTEVGRKFDRWHDVGFWEFDLSGIG